MFACVDVFYACDGTARAACCAFASAEASVSSWEGIQTVGSVSPYIPGQLYLRELPCLLAVLEKAPMALDMIIVDGYARLGPKPGLGQYLFDALCIPVIGVAKTSFAGVASAEVVRNNAKPLYVTSVGVDTDEAARFIVDMHGPFRLPTLLKRVDSLGRGNC